MLCVGGWATTVLIYRATRPERIVWDLSHGDTTDAIHWPKGLGGSGFERTAHYLDLTIISDGFRPAVSGYQMRSGVLPPKVGGGIIFHSDEVWHLYVQRKAANIDWAVVHFGSSFTTEQAYASAEDHDRLALPPREFGCLGLFGTTL